MRAYRKSQFAVSAIAVLFAPATAVAADTSTPIETRLERLESASQAASAPNASSAVAVTPAATSAPASTATAKSPKSRREPRKPSTAGSTELHTIEERLARLEAASTVAQATASASQASAAGAPTTEGKPAGDTIVEFNNLRPVIKSADGKNELAIRALVQFDTAGYFQHSGSQGAAVPTDQRDLGAGSLFRRVRLGVEGKFLQDFFYELRFEFGGSDQEGTGTIDIARVGAFIAPGLRAQVGALQPIVTLGDPTASSELTFLERPAVISTMLPIFGGESGRRGAEATYQHADVLWKGDNLIVSSAFTGQKVTTPHSGSSVDDDGTQLLGRLAYRFYSDDQTNLQIGASAADVLSISGTSPDGARNLRFRDRAEARVSGERLIDTGNIPATGATMYGLEAAGNYRNFYVGAEWYAADIDRDRDCLGCDPLAGDPSFSGWYVEGTWVLTGEPRRYAPSGTSNSIGVWAGPKPKSAVGSGGWGALEAMTRYSVVDLDWNAGSAGAATPTGGIRGGQQNIVSVGLNWYLNANLRIMTDFQWVQVDRLNTAGVDAGQDFQILQSRAQFAF